MAGSVIIRQGVLGDVPQLTSLYNHYIENTATTFDIEPHTVEEREREWFALYKESGPHRLFVAVDGDEVMGFATSSRFRVRAAYNTSVETSVYLRPERTGKGLGGKLYEVLLDALADEDLHRAYAGITLPNEPSVKLHERLGYTLIGTYREVGRKFGKYWDVAWYEKAL
jgi:phosphinothricin acetyltransferase